MDAALMLVVENLFFVNYYEHEHEYEMPFENDENDIFV